MKSLAELREEFEVFAIRCHRPVDRSLSSGQYCHPDAFLFWAGYWECAKANGIITGDDAHFVNKDSWLK